MPAWSMIWTLAERAGEASPDGMQRLLAHADWDADAVLVVDETGS